jgi:MFS family permease
MASPIRRLLPSDPTARRYLALSGIDAVGSGMFIPLSLLYLTRIVGIPPVQVGLGLTLAGIAALIATPFAGHLGDRYDPRLVAAVGYAVCAAGFAVYTLVGSFATFLLVATVIQVFDRAASSARTLVALSVAGGAERLTLLAYERSTRNVGYGVGGLCASLALASGSRAGYVAVLLANAATFAVGTAIMLRLPPAPRAAAGKEGPTIGYRSVLRDRPYVALAGISSLLWLNDSLLKVALPLWILRRTSVSPSFTGIFFALNTALVVGLQIRLSRGATDARGAGRAYRRGGVALAAACGFFAAAAEVGVAAAAALLAIAVVALTAGEMLVSAGQWAASIDLLREEARGRYLGVFSTSVSLQTALGPLAVTFALVHGGDWGWLGLAAFFVAAGLAARSVATHAASRRDARLAAAGQA